MSDLNDETTDALAQAIDRALEGEALSKLQKKARDVFQDAFDDIDYNMKEWLSNSLSAYVTEQAKNVVEALLNGDEDRMRGYLECRRGGYNHRSDGAYGNADIAKQHSVIHGKLFEHGGLALRRKIVEAHRDLITDERIKDLEDQVASLLAQVNKKEAENYALIERLNAA